MQKADFDGPLGWTTRRLTVDDYRAACIGAGIIFGLAAVPTSVWALSWPDGSGMHPRGIAFAAAVTVVGTMVYGLIIPRMSDETLVFHGPWISAITNSGSSVLVSFVIYWAGPRLGFIAVFYASPTLYAFLFFQRRYAQLVAFFVLGGFALSLVALKDPPYPGLQWVVVAGMTIGLSMVVSAIANRVEEARNAFADLNENLEQRVAEQVDELERVGRLRRFLSPQIAEVVTAEGADEMLAPHRCEVAVLFVDLRGFTAFTNAVSADRIVEVLGEYYAAVGAVLQDYDATVGGFEGDGVMAYLGDPVPRDKPAADAVAMARDIATALDPLVLRWSDGVAQLGYGIGLAFGVATLGVVGFEARRDYTPLGAVVNLAARLCADAAPGQIIVDDAVREAAGVRDVERRGDAMLKGFGTTATYALRR